MRFRLLLAALVTVALAATAVPTSLARFADTVVATASASTDTLAPPTGVAGTGGTSVVLIWIASQDAYAAGYDLYRSSSSGGLFTLVRTITPATVTTATDTPPAGLWYYVLRTRFQNWSSVDSVSAAGAIGTSTLYMPCTTTAADTAGAGDNNGYESSPARACTNDSLFALDANSGTSSSSTCGSGAAPATTKDRHKFYGFALGLPPTVTSIDGIRLRTDLKLDAISGTHNLCAQLSWNSGISWTTLQSLAITSAGETTYTFGSTTDTWGRSWTAAQLNGTNFRVRIIDASDKTTRDFYLDYVAVSVTYTP